MPRHTLAGLALLAALATPALAQGTDPSGTWLSETGETRVRIARCGGAYCGTIVATRGEARDVNNSNPALQSRPLVGVQMMSGIQPTTDGGFTGSLYNPKDGKTYSGKMRLKGANALELSGCVMGGLICRSQTWSRVN